MRARWTTARVADLATLDPLRRRAIAGIERIRFTTSHPLEFNDSLIEAYANVPKLNNLLHLPVQSGSDRILAAMKRGHTVLEYKQKLRKLRAVRPGYLISTDIIVGFPGETDEDFAATMNLIADVGLRSILQLPLQPSSGNTGRGAARRGAGGGQAAPSRAHAAALQCPVPRDFQRAWSEAASECSSSGRRSATGASWRAAPTTIAGSISQGPPTPDQSICGRRDHRSQTQFAARTSAGGRDGVSSVP